MCTVCGCGPDPSIDPDHDHDHRHDHPPHDHHAHHDHGFDHGHSHGDSHAHGTDGSLNFGAGAAGVHVTGQDQGRLIAIERDVLSKNDAMAARNRARLAEARVTAINLLSGPGSGKTTLLVETLKALGDRFPVAVIEGDQQTSNDADRIRATGAPAIQVNTGKGCHLDAEMVSHALDHLPMPDGGFLFIENVGNLVCPAGFDLGEGARAVLASVTEGEDKPLKYPDMFATADIMLVSKVDLLPYLAFDAAALMANARKIQPDLPVIETSALASGGLDAWLGWLDSLNRTHVQAAE